MPKSSVVTGSKGIPFQQNFEGSISTYANPEKLVFTDQAEVNVDPGGLESASLVTFKDQLLMTISGTPQVRGIYRTFDGLKWDLLLADAACWAYQGFPYRSNTIYLGTGNYYSGANPGFARVYRYDGTTLTIVFEMVGGQEGGNGCPESFGVAYNTAIMVARRDALGDTHGHIYRSTTGNLGSWVDVLDTGVARAIYQFINIGGVLYAFEGEPYGAPTRIYRSNNAGATWVLHATLTDNIGFRCNVPTERAMLDPIAGGNLGYITDVRGILYSYDGTTLSRMIKRPNMANTTTLYNGVRVKRIGSQMFYIIGRGESGTLGEVWVWNGEEMRCLLRTSSYGIMDIEVFKGHLYVLGDCYSDYAWKFASASDELNRAVVYRYPISLPGFKTPFKVPLWEATVLDAPGTYTAGRVPILGYQTKTFLFQATTAGTLQVRVYMNTIGWVNYGDPIQIVANTPVFPTMIGQAGIFAAQQFTPTTVPSTISGEINVG